MSEYVLYVHAIDDSLMEIDDPIFERGSVLCYTPGISWRVKNPFIMMIYRKTESTNIYDADALLYVQETQLKSLVDALLYVQENKLDKSRQELMLHKKEPSIKMP